MKNRTASRAVDHIAMLLKRIKDETEKGCSKCEYDEADGGLFNHCDTCCRRITTFAWGLAHTPTTPGKDTCKEGR